MSIVSVPDRASTYAPPPAAPRDESPIVVERWPTERPLFALSVAVSLVAWLLIVVSVIGLVYALAFGTFFFIMQLAFVAHVRGSAVKLGAEQFPALHHRVASLARRMGLQQVPDAYLMQAGGTLNAFATRFLRSHIIVLHSDLLDACGDDEAARDMIIAHELGHVHAGHLRWRWLTIPAGIVPFLGGALSRAREYTCDRYGLAGAGNVNGALTGLAILAAGASHGPRVNRVAMVRQRRDLDTAWMALGEWLGTHPPLAKRMAALDPALAAEAGRSTAGPLRAAAIIGLLFAVTIGGAITAARDIGRIMKQVERDATNRAQVQAPPASPFTP